MYRIIRQLKRQEFISARKYVDHDLQAAVAWIKTIDIATLNLALSFTPVIFRRLIP